MPRSNNSNSSRPSRGGRTRTNSTSDRPAGKKTFKSAGKASSAKPFKKSSSRASDKPYGKRADDGFDAKKSFGSRTTGSAKPFRGKRDDDSSSGERRSTGARGGKSFAKPREEGGYKKKSFSGDREERSSSRPYAKRDDSKPFRGKRDSDASGDKKSFGARTGKSFAKPREEGGYKKKSFSGDREERPSSRPYAKRDDSKPFRGKRDGDSFDEKKSFGTRGGKSFDKPREEGGYKKKSFSGDREERSSSRPYAKRDDSKPFKSRKEDNDTESAPRKKFTSTSRAFDDSSEEGSSSKKRSFSGAREERPSRGFKKDSDKPFSSRKRDDESTSEPKKFGARSAGSGFKKDSPEEERPTRGLKARIGKPDDYNKKPRKSYTAKAGYESIEEETAQAGKIRLNRYIANSGVSSRREADELITMGLITVNGKSITELGYKVNPGDEVRYESKLLKAEKPVYVLMNKPKGFLTTTVDPQERNTVMHLIGNHIKERIYPVGRLDRNTTGLLLLTNDGDLADKLMHPSYNIRKIYKVELDKPLTKADFQRILEGVQLEEGKAMVDDLAIISEDSKTIGIELHIGWNRVVRRIFESLEYDVVKLDRSVYAGLDKKDLGRGEWRYLKKEEIVRLKHYK